MNLPHWIFLVTVFFLPFCCGMENSDVKNHLEIKLKQQYQSMLHPWVLSISRTSNPITALKQIEAYEYEYPAGSKGWPSTMDTVLINLKKSYAGLCIAPSDKAWPFVSFSHDLALQKNYLEKIKLWMEKEKSQLLLVEQVSDDISCLESTIENDLISTHNIEALLADYQCAAQLTYDPIAFIVAHAQKDNVIDFFKTLHAKIPLYFIDTEIKNRSPIGNSLAHILIDILKSNIGHWQEIQAIFKVYRLNLSKKNNKHLDVLEYARKQNISSDIFALLETYFKNNQISLRSILKKSGESESKPTIIAKKISWHNE
jgi:hypothetical protein